MDWTKSIPERTILNPRSAYSRFTLNHPIACYIGKKVHPFDVFDENMIALITSCGWSDQNQSYFVELDFSSYYDINRLIEKKKFYVHGNNLLITASDASIQYGLETVYIKPSRKCFSSLPVDLDFFQEASIYFKCFDPDDIDLFRSAISESTKQISQCQNGT